MFSDFFLHFLVKSYRSEDYKENKFSSAKPAVCTKYMKSDFDSYGCTCETKFNPILFLPYELFKNPFKIKMENLRCCN